MTSCDITPREPADRVREALDRMKEQIPAVADVVDAFRDLMAERAALRDELTREEGLSLPEIDADKFLRGVPIAQEETFLFAEDDLRKAARRLIPAMEKGLPAVREKSAPIRNALLEGSSDLEALAGFVLGNRHEEIDATARNLGLDPLLLAFVVGQLLKPLVENRVRSMTPLPKDLQWVKGYCPVCGSWPGLSFIRGAEGQRLLKCSFCSHEWRFTRTQCPFCENTDSDSMRYFYSEERESERVEVCRKCERYILSIDLRNRDDVALDVAPIGLLHLDLIARQQGFRPGAITEWNVLEEPGD